MCFGFFQDFFAKIRFLSNQEVPVRHKTIYRELRTSFTRSTLVAIAGYGKSKGALWEIVGKVIFSFFDPKNRFSAFNGPINIAGGRLDILFHFPNDWNKNIEEKIEKIKIYFLPLLKIH